MRRYPDRPVVGVGAVVFHKDHVLLVRRGHPPLEGQWSLPGGAVELGETLAAAVVRETLEETGLVVSPGPLVDVVDRVHRAADGIEYHYVVVDYLCEVRGGSLAAGSDAGDVAWMRADDLDAYGVSDAAVAVVRKALAMPRPDLP